MIYSFCLIIPAQQSIWHVNQSSWFGGENGHQGWLPVLPVGRHQAAACTISGKVWLSLVPLPSPPPPPNIRTYMHIHILTMATLLGTFLFLYNAKLLEGQVVPPPSWWNKGHPYVQALPHGSSCKYMHTPQRVHMALPLGINMVLLLFLFLKYKKTQKVTHWLLNLTWLLNLRAKFPFVVFYAMGYSNLNTHTWTHKHKVVIGI